MADLFSFAAEATSRRRQMLATAFGPAIAAALADQTVIEIMLNPDGRLWLDTLDRGRFATIARLGPAEAERIIRLVGNEARRDLAEKALIVSAELPDSGERFEGLLPPLSAAPCFAIRKPALKTLSLDDYLAAGILDPAQADVLRGTIAERRNIIVAGGTSSGKTTLLNALIADIASRNERLVVLEDTRELRVAAADCVSLRARPPAVTLADLVRSTLRLRPDRIIVGEVRGGEALELLKAWNTGHPGGLASLHANSPRFALYRLESLVQEAAVSVPRQLIALAVDVIVFIAGRGNARRVSDIVAVDGLDDSGDYRLRPLTNPLSEGAML